MVSLTWSLLGPSENCLSQDFILCPSHILILFFLQFHCDSFSFAFILFLFFLYIFYFFNFNVILLSCLFLTPAFSLLSLLDYFIFLYIIYILSLYFLHLLYILPLLQFLSTSLELFRTTGPHSGYTAIIGLSFEVSHLRM